MRPRRQASQPRPPLPSQAKRTMQKPPHARRTAELTPLADTAQPPPLTTRASALPAAGRPRRGNFTQHDRQTPPRPTSAASTLPCSEHLPCSALSKATSTRVWIPLTTYARKFRPLSTYGLDLLTWLLTFTRVPMTQLARLSGQSLSLSYLSGVSQFPLTSVVQRIHPAPGAAGASWPQAWETPLSFRPCLLTSWELPLQAPQVDGKGMCNKQLAEGEVFTAQWGGGRGGRAEWGLRRGAGPPPDVSEQQGDYLGYRYCRSCRAPRCASSGGLPCTPPASTSRIPGRAPCLHDRPGGSAGGLGWRKKHCRSGGRKENG